MIFLLCMCVRTRARVRKREREYVCAKEAVTKTEAMNVKRVLNPSPKIFVQIFNV